MKVSCAVILLAGGLASRLGSDKALQQIAGKPMISHMIERLSGISNEFYVVLARNASRAEYLPFLPNFVRILNDEPEGKSPLVGIVTGLRATKSEYAVVLSCDIPFVNKRVIQLLLDRASGADAVVPRSKEGHLEPLQAVYRKDTMLCEAEKVLVRGAQSPTDAINKLAHVVYVSIEDEIEGIDSGLSTFFNVNTKQDVAEAEKLVQRQQRAEKM